ncbi:MAG: HAD family hydrolase [Verrucomicrobiales bacterium]|nr:HAD family hydrolase [Verrucomicrobiales bacterium]
MNLAFDIDDTITAAPELFAALASAPGVKKVLIVSSRGNSAESRRLTLAELELYGIRHQGLHLLEDGPEARNRCPHGDLDWYQKYLWQKVEICLREKIDVVFEDDKKVIALFRRFAPGIQVMQVCRKP